MTTPALGHFVRLVIASSRLTGRPRPLQEIALLGEEMLSPRAQLAKLKVDGWNELTVEGRATWGALYLYCFAHCRTENLQDAALFGQPLSSGQLEAVRRGRDLWIRKEVGGASEELEVLLAASAHSSPIESDAAIPTESRAKQAKVRLLARPLPPGLERYCFAVRATTRGVLRDQIECVLATVHGGVELQVFAGGEQVSGSPIGILPNGPWVKVEFIPFAASAMRVQVELRPTSEPGLFRPLRVPGTFATVRRAPTQPDEDPFDRFFRVLAAQRTLSETQATTILGSPRALRRLALEFDVQLAKRAIRVRIEPSDSGKVFVWEGEEAR